MFTVGIVCQLNSSHSRRTPPLTKKSEIKVGNNLFSISFTNEDPDLTVVRDVEIVVVSNLHCSMTYFRLEGAYIELGVQQATNGYITASSYCTAMSKNFTENKSMGNYRFGRKTYRSGALLSVKAPVSKVHVIKVEAEVEPFDASLFLGHDTLA